VGLTFDANALHRMEAGHRLDCPLCQRKVSGNWISSPTRANLYLAYLIARACIDSRIAMRAFIVFYITQKNQE